MSQALALPPKPTEDEGSLAKQINEACKALVVTNDEEAAYANQVLREVVKEKDALTDRMERGTKPIAAAVKEIKSWFKPYLAFWLDSELALKAKIAQYQISQQEAQQKAFLEAQAAHAAGNEAATIEALTVAQEAAPEKLEGTGVRWFWDIEVTAPAEVPRMWCCPDVPALKDYAKGHKDENAPPPIPGIRFVKRPVVTVRR